MRFEAYDAVWGWREMTGSSLPPSDFGLLDLATPYALHAVTDDERAEIERLVADAPKSVRAAFHDEVRLVRETMAQISAFTAIEPPAYLRDQLLAAVQVPSTPRFRWRNTVLAAAAAVIVAVVAVGIGISLRPAPIPSTAEQIFASADVRTVSGALPAGGTATVVYSPEQDAGVLVMNNVPPPPSGRVYQMWLVGADGPQSAGTMTAADVGPTTKAVLPDLNHSRTLAFTVEPTGGSKQPTTTPFAELPLT